MLSTPNIISAASFERMLSGDTPMGYPYFKDRTTDRHNIEYTPNQLFQLVSNSGFKIEKIQTLNSWSHPSLFIMNFLSHNSISIDDKGDDIFILAKVSGLDPVEFPENIYA